MKNKTIPNDSEIVLKENKLLISKTDPKGFITYCNSEFRNASGYKESELLGQQHNIVRHPDMPRVIFELLWGALKNNREFNGYIKNLCKDGQFYWVFANVTPSYNADNELLGFYSVRRKPEPEKLNYIKELYNELLDIEQQASTKEATEKSKYKLDSIMICKEMEYDEFILSI